MKNFIVVTLFLLFEFAYGRIVPETELQGNEQLFTVAIFAQSNLVAASTIISSKYLLSAASGLDQSYKIEDYTGYYNNSKNQIQFNKIISHDKYKPGTFINNVAVIEIKNAISGIKVDLADKNPSTATNMEMYGFQANKVLTINTLMANRPDYCDVGDAIFCASSFEKQITISAGDVGGPLVNDMGPTKQYGITLGNTKELKQPYSIIVYTSVANQMNFIKPYITN